MILYFLLISIQNVSQYIQQISSGSFCDELFIFNLNFAHRYSTHNVRTQVRENIQDNHWRIFRNFKHISPLYILRKSFWGICDKNMLHSKIKLWKYSFKPCLLLINIDIRVWLQKLFQVIESVVSFDMILHNNSFTFKISVEKCISENLAVPKD